MLAPTTPPTDFLESLLPSPKSDAPSIADPACGATTGDRPRSAPPIMPWPSSDGLLEGQKPRVVLPILLSAEAGAASTIASTTAAAENPPLMATTMLILLVQALEEAGNVLVRLSGSEPSEPASMIELRRAHLFRRGLLLRGKRIVIDTGLQSSSREAEP